MPQSFNAYNTLTFDFDWEKSNEKASAIRIGDCEPIQPTDYADYIADEYLSDDDFDIIAYACGNTLGLRGSNMTKQSRISYFLDFQGFVIALLDTCVFNETFLGLDSHYAIHQDETTHAIREYKDGYCHFDKKFHKTNEVYDPSARPRVRADLYTYRFGISDFLESSGPTRRDLRPHIKKTAAYEHCGDVGKAYLLACANPEVNPTETDVSWDEDVVKVCASESCPCTALIITYDQGIDLCFETTDGSVVDSTSADEWIRMKNEFDAADHDASQFADNITEELNDILKSRDQTYEPPQKTNTAPSLGKLCILTE